MSNQHKITIPKIQLIGLYGHAGSGKDTVAAYITKEYRKCYADAFARPLKAAASQAFGIDLDCFNTSSLKEHVSNYWGVSPRQIAQFIGTELFREAIQKLLPGIENDFWIKRFVGNINDELSLYGQPNDPLYDPGDTIVITDVRFDNEVDFILDNGGIVIALERDSATGPVGIVGHTSEKLYFSFDGMDNTYKIFNNSTLEDLYETIDDILINCKLNFIQY